MTVTSRNAYSFQSEAKKGTYRLALSKPYSVKQLVNEHCYRNTWKVSYLERVKNDVIMIYISTETH